jgi:hypothetical protein
MVEIAVPEEIHFIGITVAKAYASMVIARAHCLMSFFCVVVDQN